MALTNEQLPTLKAAILAETDSVVVAALAASNNAAIADWYNEDGTFIVWRNDLSESDIVSKESPTGTTWDWTAYIDTSVAEKMAWERIFNGTFSINPSLPNVRVGIADIFNSPQGANQRAHLLAMSTRFATRGEGLFATGTGTQANPGLLVFAGSVSTHNVNKALSLP